jgi:hypothetical protein
MQPASAAVDHPLSNASSNASSGGSSPEPPAWQGHLQPQPRLHAPSRRSVTTPKFAELERQAVWLSESGYVHFEREHERPRILVVEDDPVNLRLLGQWFGSQ